LLEAERNSERDLMAELARLRSKLAAQRAVLEARLRQHQTLIADKTAELAEVEVAQAEAGVENDALREKFERLENDKRERSLTMEEKDLHNELSTQLQQHNERHEACASQKAEVEQLLLAAKHAEEVLRVQLEAEEMNRQHQEKLLHDAELEVSHAQKQAAEKAKLVQAVAEKAEAREVELLGVAAARADELEAERAARLKVEQEMEIVTQKKREVKQEMDAMHLRLAAALTVTDLERAQLQHQGLQLRDQHDQLVDAFSALLVKRATQLGLAADKAALRYRATVLARQKGQLAQSLEANQAAYAEQLAAGEENSAKLAELQQENEKLLAQVCCSAL
jgi:hypothetical protein